MTNKVSESSKVTSVIHTLNLGSAVESTLSQYLKRDCFSFYLNNCPTPVLNVSDVLIIRPYDKSKKDFQIKITASMDDILSSVPEPGFVFKLLPGNKLLPMFESSKLANLKKQTPENTIGVSIVNAYIECYLSENLTWCKKINNLDKANLYLTELGVKSTINFISFEEVLENYIKPEFLHKEIITEQPSKETIEAIKNQINKEIDVLFTSPKMYDIKGISRAYRGQSNHSFIDLVDTVKNSIISRELEPIISKKPSDSFIDVIDRVTLALSPLTRYLNDLIKDDKWGLYSVDKTAFQTYIHRHGDFRIIDWEHNNE